MADEIRVLVIDDAAVVRAMLSTIIDREPDMVVAGTAADGRAGIEQAEALRPDVIVLDIDMPVMSGMEALGILRTRLPATPVIIFSTLSQAGAVVTLEALAMGAADYSTKPSNAGSAAAAAEQVRAELIVKIRGLMATSSAEAGGASEPGDGGSVTTRPRLSQPVDAILIGSSTGGPAALEEVLPQLPGDLQVPILLVQHMPPTFTTVLAERLNKLCPFPVHEAREGMAVEGGHCYLAAGGLHMRPTRTSDGVRLALDDGPKVKSCRPSVDVLFDAAAEVYRNRVLVAVLTGMGDDGLDACSRLIHHNVDIIVQDEATSVVWGMPGAIARAGHATRCLPLTEIPNAMLDSAARRAPARPRAARAVTS